MADQTYVISATYPDGCPYRDSLSKALDGHSVVQAHRAEVVQEDVLVHRPHHHVGWPARPVRVAVEPAAGRVI